MLVFISAISSGAKSQQARCPPPTYAPPLGTWSSLGNSRGGIIRTKAPRTTRTSISVGISHHERRVGPLSGPLREGGWGGESFA